MSDRFGNKQMSNQKLILTRGLPASGKTTWAKEQVKKDGSLIRLNRDDLRVMLHEGRFSRANEKIVTSLQQEMALSAANNGRSIIIDDTNLNPKVVSFWKTWKTSLAFSIKDFTDVPLWECIKRDSKRERSVGEDVIRGMWEKYLMPPLRKPQGLYECIIVDMDGTLAIMGDRSPYDWDKVDNDLPNPAVVEYVKGQSTKVKVVIVSGRDSICRPLTTSWLLKHLDGCHHALYMRPTGDNRPDEQIKKEIFQNHIENKYDVKVVLDDRQKVVDFWRSEGLPVWQVGHGRF